tara:strand:+ start:644 stop:1411 length:768 start_codon:yes stop_codon:yes gene_type:complete
MDTRPLGRTGLSVSHIGWGTVKLGRNTALKFPEAFALPSDEEASSIVHGMLDLGITLIDTAPAYGLAEERLGAAIHSCRDDLVLCTKVGETFEDGVSHHDFSAKAVSQSLEQSLRRLRTDHVDVLLVHADDDDLALQDGTDLVQTLQRLRDEGKTRSIGFSGKTTEAAEAALGWADVLMCAYTMEDRTHESVIEAAASAGVGVLLKKVLGSGHLPADEALQFVLNEAPIASSVASIVIGSLNSTRMKSNVAIAQR